MTNGCALGASGVVVYSPPYLCECLFSISPLRARPATWLVSVLTWRSEVGCGYVGEVTVNIVIHSVKCERRGCVTFSNLAWVPTCILVHFPLSFRLPSSPSILLHNLLATLRRPTRNASLSPRAPCRASVLNAVHDPACLETQTTCPELLWSTSSPTPSMVNAPSVCQLQRIPGHSCSTPQTSTQCASVHTSPWTHQTQA